MKKNIILALLVATATMGFAQEKKNKKVDREGMWTIGFDLRNGINGGSLLVKEGDMCYGCKNSRWGAGLGLHIDLQPMYHLPISELLNLDMGLGYRMCYYQMNNNITYNETTQHLETYIPQTYHGDFNQFLYHSIQVPLMLAITSEMIDDWVAEIALGVRLGYNFCSQYHKGHYYTNEEGALASDVSDVTLPAGKVINNFSCELVFKESFIPVDLICTQLSTELGIEYYVNLLPTIVDMPDGAKKVHEFGIALKL